jgi:hypothetical protein
MFFETRFLLFARYLPPVSTVGHGNYMSDSGAGILVPRNFEPALGVLSYTCSHRDDRKNTKEFDDKVEAVFDSSLCAERASGRSRFLTLAVFGGAVATQPALGKTPPSGIARKSRNNQKNQELESER